MSEVKLQPCPFCGSAASIRGDFGLQQLGCSNFDCFAAEFGLAAHTPTRRRESIAAWNRRASRSPVVGAVGGEPTDEQKDAARYRWLRKRATLCDTCGENGWTVEVCLDYAVVPVEVGATVDEAIDAAMGGIGVSPTGSPEGEVSNG